MTITQHCIALQDWSTLPFVVIIHLYAGSLDHDVARIYGGQKSAAAGYGFGLVQRLLKLAKQIDQNLGVHYLLYSVTCLLCLV